MNILNNLFNLYKTDLVIFLQNAWCENWLAAVLTDVVYIR